MLAQFFFLDILSFQSFGWKFSFFDNEFLLHAIRGSSYVWFFAQINLSM